MPKPGQVRKYNIQSNCMVHVYSVYLYPSFVRERWFSVSCWRAWSLDPDCQSQSGSSVLEVFAGPCLMLYRLHQLRPTGHHLEDHSVHRESEITSISCCTQQLANTKQQRWWPNADKISSYLPSSNMC